MSESLRCLHPESIVTGWDFSTGGVKCLAFDLTGRTVAEIRLTTDLWRGEHDENGLLLQPGVYELVLAGQELSIYVQELQV